MKNLLFGFEGRINRVPFWIAGILVGIACDVAMVVLSGGIPAAGEPGAVFESVGPGRAIAMLVLLVVAVWIGLALAVKRWHDRNKSGWWVLIVLIPVVGGLWYLIECGFLRGTAGSNRYGADPLAV
jgi:uncharacterized membrane protein YhaH (DUF805 family)